MMVVCVTLPLLGNYDLRIDMEDFEGNQRFAEYKNFKVDDEKVNTSLKLLHGAVH